MTFYSTDIQFLLVAPVLLRVDYMLHRLKWASIQNWPYFSICNFRLASFWSQHSANHLKVVCANIALLWVDHNLEIDNLIVIWNLITIIENVYFNVDMLFCKMLETLTWRICSWIGSICKWWFWRWIGGTCRLGFWRCIFRICWSIGSDCSWLNRTCKGNWNLINCVTILLL